MTGGRRDESVSVSLRTLMELEDERVEQERRRALEREAAEARRAREALEREREAEQQREREARAADEERRRREREEATKLAAIHQATIEQARIAEEARARALESDRERRHQVEIERVRAEAAREKRSSRTFVSVSAGVLFGVLASGALYGGVVRPEVIAQRAELDRRLAVSEQKGVALAQSVEDAKRDNDALRKSIAALEARRTAPTATPPAPAPHGPKHGPLPPRGPAKARPPGGVCPAGDPLCVDGHILR